MKPAVSDALVFFGATDELAYKKIFPALQAMFRHGNLNVPIIGVAKANWNLDQLRARARDSVEKHGGLDAAAFPKLLHLLHYVDRDYRDPATFQTLRKELGSAQHPAHYLAIPPELFEMVVDQLGKSGSAKGARVVIEKPFGRDLGSARELNGTLLRSFKESSIFRIDHYLGKVAVRLYIHSWRWQGVPFYMRAGKRLSVTCTEVFVQLRKPPLLYATASSPANYFRFRISPNVLIALGCLVKTPGEQMAGEQTELLAIHHPDIEEMEAYERLLSDAMKGNAAQFAREDYVEEAWRIVDPVIRSATPVHQYEP